MTRHSNGLARMIVALVALVVLALAGCSDGGSVDRVGEGSDETSTRPELVEEALAFGGFVLPANAELMMAQVDSALDTRYQVAFVTDAAGVQQLLSDSGIDGELTNDYPPYGSVIAGPALATSPSVRAVQDTYGQPSGTTVFRSVVVDERDPGRLIVHLEAHTT